MNVKGELHQQSGYDFMAAVFDVYNEMRSGFLEEVYHKSLGARTDQSKNALRKDPRSKLRELGKPLAGDLACTPAIPLLEPRRPRRGLFPIPQPDLIIIGEIVVELKAVKTLVPEHEAQLINYLRATRKRVGYLIKFGSFPKLEWKRFVL